MNKKLKTIIEDIFEMEGTDLNAVIDAVKMILKDYQHAGEPNASQSAMNS